MWSLCFPTAVTRVRCCRWPSARRARSCSRAAWTPPCACGACCPPPRTWCVRSVAAAARVAQCLTGRGAAVRSGAGHRLVPAGCAGGAHGRRVGHRATRERAAVGVRRRRRHRPCVAHRQACAARVLAGVCVLTRSRRVAAGTHGAVWRRGADVCGVCARAAQPVSGGRHALRPAPARCADRPDRVVVLLCGARCRCVLLRPSPE
jgi:hypothetical protein